MLPQLQAERRLLNIEAVAVPDMEPHKRASLLQGLISAAQGKRKARRLSDALLEAGIQVKHIPKAETEGHK